MRLHSHLHICVVRVTLTQLASIDLRLHTTQSYRGNGTHRHMARTRAADVVGPPSTRHMLTTTLRQITTVHAAFPDIPRPNIHYDLLRTGSAEVTSNKILERGVLDAVSQGLMVSSDLR